MSMITNFTKVLKNAGKVYKQNSNINYSQVHSIWSIRNAVSCCKFPLSPSAQKVWKKIKKNLNSVHINVSYETY